MWAGRVSEAGRDVQPFPVLEVGGALDLPLEEADGCGIVTEGIDWVACWIERKSGVSWMLWIAAEAAGGASGVGESLF